eukprot:1942291-Prymnesium_polylepis.1
MLEAVVTAVALLAADRRVAGPLVAAAEAVPATPVAVAAQAAQAARSTLEPPPPQPSALDPTLEAAASRTPPAAERRTTPCAGLPSQVRSSCCHTAPRRPHRPHR